MNYLAARLSTARIAASPGIGARRDIPVKSGEYVSKSNGSNPTALNDLLCFDVYSAARAITRAYRPLLSRLGLTYPQYLVMVTLWESAPRTVKDLGERLELDSGTLSPLLKRLEASGLVTRRRRLDDERTVEITPTPRGRALLRAAERVPTEMESLMGISAEEGRKLRTLLGKLTASLESHSDDAPAASVA
jgi:MarR family transcriptional regulator, organic hydroperoxide resistance regulator